MLELLCGPIVSVMAQMTDRTSAGSFRTLAIALQFASGAVGSLVGSYDTAYAYPDTHALEVSGTRGRLLIEDTVRRYTFSPTTARRPRSGRRATSTTWTAASTPRSTSTSTRCSRRSGPASRRPVHAQAGRRALELALASIESFRTGRRVEVGTASFRAAQAPPVTSPPPSP